MKKYINFFLLDQNFNQKKLVTSMQTESFRPPGRDQEAALWPRSACAWQLILATGGVYPGQRAMNNSPKNNNNNLPPSLSAVAAP